jgi:hypothetical protein
VWCSRTTILLVYVYSMLLECAHSSKLVKLEMKC